MAEKYDVVARVISQKGTCVAEHKVGDEWAIGGTTPAGTKLHSCAQSYLIANEGGNLDRKRCTSSHAYRASVKPFDKKGMILPKISRTIVCISWQKLREHKVEALTRWYDHNLDVFSEPVEQYVLQYRRC